MDANRFNQILVVDSIPAGQYNTAKRLFEDIVSHAKACSPSPTVRYLRVACADELIQCILKCRKDADEQDIIPMLHIECHGNEDGFEFADGSFANWEMLKPALIELNIATCLNLLITVAACTGGALAKVISIDDRAPFWGLIAPTKTLTDRDLENAYRALYLTLLSTKSPTAAVQAMDAATIPGQFWRTTSQDLFEKIWANYKADYCNAEALVIRLKRIKGLLEQTSEGSVSTMSELKDQLKSREPKIFEQFRNVFFMYDLFPGHTNRFPIEYTA